jgi:choline dehydrogenase-like flavoprotein
MTFTAQTYANMVAEDTVARGRLIAQYSSPRNDFDVIIIGSGIGGGLLADDLADRLGDSKRLLLIEAGSFIYPTHVYNLSRFPNASVAKHFGCATFWQQGTPGSPHFIGEQPQLAFGGRSIFWSGLIPTVQPWELDFFPPAVRADLAGGLLNEAGARMNSSVTLGDTARHIVDKLRAGPLGADFIIEETPRALHQPYLRPDGTPQSSFYTEGTGVFNTAELIINQLGLTPGVTHGDGPGLHLLLNTYAEDIQDRGGDYVVVVRNVLTGSARFLSAPKVVLAGGSIESPKLLRRSSMHQSLPEHVKRLVGRGLTDHPTSNEVSAAVTEIDGLPLPATAHAKIIFYSRGGRDDGEILYPFNIEMNVNHEWWHLRNNDPGASTDAPAPAGTSRVDLKFSFANPLDDGNEIRTPPPFGYVPEVVFRDQSHMDHLRDSRFPAIAGWQKDYDAIFAVMNDVARKALAPFRFNGSAVTPDGRYGQNGLGFGWGTVHHAVGSLRMPFRAHLDAPFQAETVVDEDLHVVGTTGLYVSDMSVIPISSAANPVRTLAALTLRLSRHLG